MKIHLAPVAVLAFGVALGCAGSSATSQPTEEPVQEAAAAMPDAAPRMENMDTESAAALLSENSDVVILDIRTPAEFERGHLEGAVNIDYRAEDFADQLGLLDKDKTYLVH